MAGTEPAAVLLTGSFGVGKSTVAIEMADLLDERRASFALLDLDFLAWFDTGTDRPANEDMRLANLAVLRDNYLGAGVTHFVVAGFVRDRPELERLRATLAMPLTVVRLTAPWPEIERRLRSDPASSRTDDLREAAKKEHAEAGVGLEDLTIPNDRPLSEVALEILAKLGWLT